MGGVSLWGSARMCCSQRSWDLYELEGLVAVASGYLEDFGECFGVGDEGMLVVIFLPGLEGGGISKIIEC
jgi:hypothetical protein